MPITNHIKRRCCIQMLMLGNLKHVWIKTKNNFHHPWVSQIYSHNLVYSDVQYLHIIVQMMQIKDGSGHPSQIYPIWPNQNNMICRTQMLTSGPFALFLLSKFPIGSAKSYLLYVINHNRGHLVCFTEQKLEQIQDNHNLIIKPLIFDSVKYRTWSQLSQMFWLSAHQARFV